MTETWRDKYKAILRKTFDGKFMRLGSTPTGRSEEKRLKEFTAHAAKSVQLAVNLDEQGVEPEFSVCEPRRTSFFDFAVEWSGSTGALKPEGRRTCMSPIFAVPYGQGEVCTASLKGYPEAVYYGKLRKADRNNRMPRGLVRRHKTRLSQSRWMECPDGVQRFQWLPSIGLEHILHDEYRVVDQAKFNEWRKRYAAL